MAVPPTKGIVRLSRRMAVLCLLLAVAMLSLNAASWIVPGGTGLAGLDLGFGSEGELLATLGISSQDLAWWQRLGAVVLSSVPLLALTGGLLHLRRLFQGYARGEYFSPVAASHLGKGGRAVLAWVVLKLLCEPLLSAWLTMAQPPGHRMVTLTIGTGTVVALFLAACVTVVAYILGRASELAQENSQFV